MRLAYAVFCQSHNEVARVGTTFRGVPGQVAFEIPYEGKPPTHYRFQHTICVGLAEGTPGTHSIWVVAQHPGRIHQLTPDVRRFRWPPGASFHPVCFELDVQIAITSGTWEFDILMDAEPLGTVLLPIEFNLAAR